MSEDPAIGFDPASILGKLKEVVAPDKKPDASGGSGSWIGTIIAVVVAIAAIAAWAWISRQRGKELAKLRHEKFVTEVQDAQDAVDVTLSEDAAKIEASKAVVAASEEKVRLIEADIRAEEARYAADLRAIDSIRSWRDVR